MFEDAMLESAGRLKTQSKYWTLGTFALNTGLLAVMILLPLLHPEALPRTAITPVLITPPPPVMQVETRTVAAQQPRTTMLTVPSIIPKGINEKDELPNQQPIGVMTPGTGPADSVASNNPLSFISPPTIAVLRPKPAEQRMNVSRGVAAGNLITQTLPVYPPIAQAAHITGVVVLRAVISKTGTIENLMVQSGPVLLRQAALDGVRNWRYKPFLLNGEPTEVDTTITVNFTSSS